MAKRASFVFMEKKRVKRGVHAKSKTSKFKGSENYKKVYNGQGK
tara:strand:+ start:135 stop:266 length:132 start_codon:yes stop_codon:yes gene_type:complete